MLFSLLRTIILVSIMALPMAIALADEDEKPETVVNELAWGESLYDHFRGKPLQAITRLTARIEQGKIVAHKEQAELLLSGIYLDYGMPNKAAEKLASINVDSLSPVLASKMYLANARIFYQQQEFASAEIALQKVNIEGLSESDKNLAAFIYAQVYFSTNRFAEAAETLDKVADTSNLQLYANYNLGLSLLQLADKESQTKAIGLLDNLASMSVFDQEQYALADQAKLALALYAIENGDQLYAELYLSDIRLNGLVSQDALLLLGWSYANQGNYQQALTYWQALADNADILSPVVQEAWLAVPYAWQQGGDKAKALTGYHAAFALQERAQQQLEQIKISQLWQDFISQNTSESDLKDYPAFYRELTGDPVFHELLTQWQELQQLKTHLKTQSRRIPILELAVKENQSRYLAKTEFIKAQLSTISLAEFETQVAGFKNQLLAQKQLEIPLALLPKKESDIWQRIVRSQENVKTLAEAAYGDQNDLQQKISKVDLLKGVAKWHIHRHRPSYEWQAVKALGELERSHAELVSQHQQLEQQIIALKPALQMDDQQILDMVSKNRQMLSEIESLQMEITNSMANIYQQVIVRRLVALDNLAEQANLAIARLTYEIATEEYRRD